jgi:hypothetical protein
MPQILFFFQKAIDVKLPLFIEKLIENKLEENFQYDFFEQNKEGIYANITSAFKISNLECLVKGIKNCPNFFENNNKNVNNTDNHVKSKNDKSDKLKLIFSKLTSGETMQNIKNIETKLIYYVLFIFYINILE